MNFGDIFHNKLLIAAVTAWAVAQIIKTVLYFIVNRELDITRLFGDGGMPSGHSATVSALATMTAMMYGFKSTEFAIAAILAIIVMHDAMGVRRESGKHAQAINNLMLILDENMNPDEMLKEFLGHTPSQVSVGCIIGIINAIVVYNIIY